MNRIKSPKTAKNLRPGNISPRLEKLGNSIPVYLISAGSQPVTRIDLMFRAGSWWQTKPLAASSANAMLSEGTINLTGEQIAKKVDYYGAFINSSADRDNAFISIYTLTRYIDEILPLCADIAKNPSFPERELETLLERRRQNFLIQKTRVSSLAREQFAASVFGKDHPYGQTLALEDFDNLTCNDLRSFHEKYYRSGNCTVFVSGRFDSDKITAALDQLFGGNDWHSRPPVCEAVPPEPDAERIKMLIAKDDAVQSALRIGRRLFPGSHPDHPGMMVLNSILGGHFGSRLMQNIREKRGYTYGIGSMLTGLRFGGYLAIVSEVGGDNREEAVNEIYREMKELCDKPVSARELDLTRRHMLGEVLRSFDGPFAWLESIRNLAETDMDSGYFDKLVDTINTITPQQIMELARKYLVKGKMVEVVAGK